MNVDIIPAAQRDIAEAADFYRQRRPGLDDEFLAELDSTVALIASDPQMFEQVRPGLRRCLLNRYPYGVYYRVPDADTVRIILVKHHRRHPGFGMRRK